MDIKIKHLGKAYGEQQILRDFSCLFPEGKTTCIRGKSGSGKTTLLRLLLGLESPDTGEIEGMEGCSGISGRPFVREFKCSLQYTNGVSGTDYRPAAGGGL